MCDMVDSVCRHCLKENFTLINIFSYRSPSGEPVFRVLNFIYDLKIFQGDGLPSKICVPCLWKMFEFDTYKKNVNYAEAEMKKFLSRPITNEVSSEQTSNRVALEAEEIPMNVAGEVPDDVRLETEVAIKHEIDAEESEMLEDIQPEEDILKASIKDEIDIEEWKMPEDVRPEKYSLKGQSCGRYNLLNEDNAIIHYDLISSDVISTGNDLEPEGGERVVTNQVSEELQSSDSCEVNSTQCLRGVEESSDSLSLEKGSSDVSLPGTIDVNGANEGISKKSLRYYGIERKASVDKRSNISENKHESEVYGSEPAAQIKTVYTCNVCNRSYALKNDLSRHVRVHYNDRPFKCKLCDQTFRWEVAKDLHELRHFKEKNNARNCQKESTGKLYSCKICKKEYKNLNSLRYHSNLHQKKYQCSICGNAFGCKIALNIHMRIHSNQKPYSCKVCKKSFNEKSKVKRHMSTHSEKRLFPCDLCDKRFKTQNSKASHELLHLKGS